MCAKDRDSSRQPHPPPRTQPSSSPLKPEFKEVSRSCASRLQASSHAPRVAAAPRHRRSPAHCCRRQDKSRASLSAKDRVSSRLPHLLPRTQPSSSPLKPEFKEVSRSCASRLQASSHAPRVAAAPRHRRSPAHCCRRQDKSRASPSAKDRVSSRLPHLLPRTQLPSSPLKPESKEVHRRGFRWPHTLCSALENAAFESSRSVLPGGGCAETAMP